MATSKPRTKASRAEVERHICVDTAALLSLSEHLRQIPGIEQTETTIVLKTQIERPTVGDKPYEVSRG
jgi:hypothetical protein